MPNGSTNLETDMVPPRLSRAIIRRRKGKPSASSMRAVFFRTLPGVYVRAFSLNVAAFSAALSVARCSRSLIRLILLGFQYLVINLSIGILSCGVEAGVWVNEVLPDTLPGLLPDDGTEFVPELLPDGAHCFRKIVIFDKNGELCLPLQVNERDFVAVDIDVGLEFGSGDEFGLTE